MTYKIIEVYFLGIPLFMPTMKYLKTVSPIEIDRSWTNLWCFKIYIILEYPIYRTGVFVPTHTQDFFDLFWVNKDCQQCRSHCSYTMERNPVLYNGRDIPDHNDFQFQWYALDCMSIEAGAWIHSLKQSHSLGCIFLRCMSFQKDYYFVEWQPHFNIAAVNVHSKASTDAVSLLAL